MTGLIYINDFYNNKKENKLKIKTKQNDNLDF